MILSFFFGIELKVSDSKQVLVCPESSLSAIAHTQLVENISQVVFEGALSQMQDTSARRQKEGIVNLIYRTTLYLADPSDKTFEAWLY